MPRPKKKLTFMQPITRVHNIYRIRTIVNAVTEMNKKKRLPGDDEIGKVLAERGLSKVRKGKIKDRIMRRARDHLLTASYMGLLSRTGRPFGYSSSTAGKYLASYALGEECPKDEIEEAVFIDKTVRLKLTNVYDMQWKSQYSDLRSRPVLFMLYVLHKSNWLHEHQIAVAAGGRKCDPLLLDRQSASILAEVTKYGGATKEKLHQFYEDFGVRDSDAKNMTRNIRPLLDWCASLGLVLSKEVDGTPGRWWTLSERGEKILELYKNKMPIWFDDLGRYAIAKAALLIFYQYTKRSGITFDDDFLKLELQIGLVKVQISRIVDELTSLGIRFKDGVCLDTDLDFTLEYDVPPEQREEVSTYVKIIAHLAHLKPDNVALSTETLPIEQLAEALEKEQELLRKVETDRFAKRTAITSDPVIEQVKNLIPSTGVLGQYKSDFEKEVAILLRLVRLNAIKYQGQLADRCHKHHITTFFENNPDILILNGIESLVECKSTGEWHPPLSGVKSVPKEIIIYQQYFPEVKPNSVVLVYEGSLDTESRNQIIGILSDTKDIVFVNKNFLINCIYKPAQRQRLITTIKNPQGADAENRLLIE